MYVHVGMGLLKNKESLSFQF